MSSRTLHAVLSVSKNDIPVGLEVCFDDKAYLLIRREGKQAYSALGMTFARKGIAR